MFPHSRPHPAIHVLRWHGFRAVRRVVVGSVLILLGAGYLLRGQGLISTTDLWLIAPLAVALSGIARLAFDRSVGGLIGALLRFAVAAYLVVAIEHLGGLTFATTWPVLLIAVGVAQVGRAMFGRRLRRERNW